MVIIITGPTHVGKTKLAQRLLETIKYPYLSIDHLKMGLIRSGKTNLTPDDDRELVDLLWPIVREMVKTAIENHQNLIVEGCYVPFDWRRDFDERYLENIRFIGLAMSDAYIDAHFDAVKAHANDIETRLDDGYCTKELLKAENRRMTEGFQDAGEKVFVVTGDYEETIGEILGRFLDT